jgi:hypothetical protein
MQVAERRIIEHRRYAADVNVYFIDAANHLPFRFGSFRIRSSRRKELMRYQDIAACRVDACGIYDGGYRVFISGDISGVFGD